MSSGVQTHDAPVNRKDAPFPTGEDDLVPGAVACGRCPKNTASTPDLFGDVKGAGAGVCTDPTCFAAKKETAISRTVETAKAKGQTVIEGKAAKEIFPHGTYNARGGYVKLDEEKFAGGKYLKVSTILGKSAEAVLVRAEDGELIPVVKESALRAAMKAKGLKDDRASTSASPADKKRKEKRATEEAYRNAVLVQIVKRSPMKLHRNDLMMIAGELFEGGYDHSELFAAMGWPEPTGSDWKRHSKAFDAKLPKLTETGLNGLILFLTLNAAVGNQTYDNSHKHLEATAKRLQINTAQIRKDIAAAAIKPAASKGKKPVKSK